LFLKCFFKQFLKFYQIFFSLYFEDNSIQKINKKGKNNIKSQCLPNGLVVMATECDKYRQPIGIGGWGRQEMSAIVVDGDHTKHTTAIEIMVLTS